MDWKEKITVGMELIKQGCQEVKEWTKCNDCPFGKFCDYITYKTDDGEIPETLF